MSRFFGSLLVLLALLLAGPGWGADSAGSAPKTLEQDGTWIYSKLFEPIERIQIASSATLSVTADGPGAKPAILSFRCEKKAMVAQFFWGQYVLQDHQLTLELGGVDAYPGLAAWERTWFLQGVEHPGDAWSFMDWLKAAPTRTLVVQARNREGVMKRTFDLTGIEKQYAKLHLICGKR